MTRTPPPAAATRRGGRFAVAANGLAGTAGAVGAGGGGGGEDGGGVGGITERRATGLVFRATGSAALGTETAGGVGAAAFVTGRADFGLADTKVGLGAAGAGVARGTGLVVTPADGGLVFAATDLADLGAVGGLAGDEAAPRVVREAAGRVAGTLRAGVFCLLGCFKLIRW